MATAQDIIDLYTQHGKMLALAESCTGGMIAASLTDIAGSSAVLDAGFVTYSNQAKMDLLGVDPALLDEFGAVSKEVARAMAAGVLQKRPSSVDVALSITGVAGPGGGSVHKPVGLVHFAVATHHHMHHTHVYFDETLERADIRQQATVFALTLLKDAL